MPVDFLPPELLHHDDDKYETVTSTNFPDEKTEPQSRSTLRKSASAPQLRSHMGMQWHTKERGSMSSWRDSHAMHDEGHPHHERHKEIAEEGYEQSGPQSRVDSVKAFFDGLPKFDPDVVPLKVRKVGAKFAEENGACSCPAIRSTIFEPAV